MAYTYYTRELSKVFESSRAKRDPGADGALRGVCGYLRGLVAFARQGFADLNERVRSRKLLSDSAERVYTKRSPRNLGGLIFWVIVIVVDGWLTYALVTEVSSHARSRAVWPSACARVGRGVSAWAGRK